MVAKRETDTKREKRGRERHRQETQRHTQKERRRETRTDRHRDRPEEDNLSMYRFLILITSAKSLLHVK